MEAINPKSRHWPCRVLHDHGIPCVVWFEDAIAHYGSPTVVFDLYILVPDIETAADMLVQDGWNLVSQGKGKIARADVDSPQRRLTSPTSRENGNAILPVAQSCTSEPSPEPSDTLSPLPATSRSRLVTTVLLSAADWNFSLPEFEIFNTDMLENTVFPPLAGLVDALIDSILDCPPDKYMLHLAVHITSLYEFAPALKEKAFAEQLKYEHRQYHYDVLAGMDHATVPFIAHQRGIREALRQGTHELTECSTHRDNELLFNKAVQARLLASMQKPDIDMEEHLWDDEWEVYDDSGGLEEKYRQLFEAAMPGVDSSTVALRSSGI
jgi:hypothetical protein